MARQTITRTLLRDLSRPDGDTKVRIFDDHLAGFIAEVRRNLITFYFRYSDHRRRHREIKLGRLGEVTVEQARRQAMLLKSRVALGDDPAAEAARRRAVPTLAAFASERFMPFVCENLRSADNVETYLRLRIVPVLGRMALDEIT